MATCLLLLDQPRYMTMVAMREVQKVFCRRDYSDADVITRLALDWTTSSSASSSPSPVERRARSAAVVWLSSSITRARGDTS